MNSFAECDVCHDPINPEQMVIMANNRILCRGCAYEFRGFDAQGTVLTVKPPDTNEPHSTQGDKHCRGR